MRRRGWLGVFVFLWALGCAAPAAAFRIGFTEYMFFANTALTIKKGPVTIPGNVGVNDAGGRLRIGANSDVKGTAAADRMFFGTDAAVEACAFNRTIGGQPGAVCITQGPAVPLPMTPWPPLTVPDIDPCVTAGGNNLTVPAGGAMSPPTGSCFGAVDVKDGGTLNLVGGRAYNFKSLRLQNTAILNGNGAIVKVKGSVVAQPNASMIGVTLYTAGSRGVAVGVGRGTLLDNVSLTAPNGTVHIHADVIIGLDVEVLADRIIVEPIISVVP